MMRRALPILAAGTLITTLAACSGDATSKPDASDPSAFTYEIAEQENQRLYDGFLEVVGNNFTVTSVTRTMDEYPSLMECGDGSEDSRYGSIPAVLVSDGGSIEEIAATISGAYEDAIVPMSDAPAGQEGSVAIQGKTERGTSVYIEISAAPEGSLISMMSVTECFPVEVAK